MNSLVCRWIVAELRSLARFIEHFCQHGHGPPVKLVGTWTNKKGVSKMAAFTIVAGQTLHGTIKAADATGAVTGDPTGDVSFTASDTINFTLTKTGPFTADITAVDNLTDDQACTVSYTDGAGLTGSDTFSMSADVDVPSQLVGTWIA
jgi:hypothetical protein